MRALSWLILIIVLSPVFLVVGIFWAPPETLARLAERGASNFADMEVELAQLDVAWFDGGPGIALDSFVVPHAFVDGEHAEVVINPGALLRAQLVMDHVELRDTTVNVVRNAEGQWNWQALLMGSSVNDVQPAENEDTTALALPAIDQIKVTDVKVTVEDAVLDRQGVVILNASGSTTDPDRSTELNVEGSLEELPVSMDVSVSPLAELSESLADLALAVSARVGETLLELDGQIGDPSTLTDLDLIFAVEAPDLQDAEVVAGLTMPILPPWRVEGAVRRDGADWLLRRFDGKVGDSDLQGDIRIDPTTAPLTVYANLISNTLDLDDLAGLFGGVPDPEESATRQQQDEAERRESDDKLLPDQPLALAALTEYFTGAVEYRADAVRSPVWPIDSLDVRVVIDEGKTDVTRLMVGAAEGRIEGSARLDATQQPTAGEFELEVNSINLREIMSTLGIDNDSFGRIGGEIKFWFAGDTVAEIAASLDGGLFLLMTEGELDALLVELSGIDLMESLFLAIDPGKTLTSIDCAYLDIQAADGVADIARLIIDSSDTVFVGDGQIDLNDESLDVAIEPHPKDLSVLSAQSSVRVRGTVGDLQVIPGKELPLRAAAATVLGTLATPIAALLPLVQTGDGEDSEYCDGLIGRLDNASDADASEEGE